MALQQTVILPLTNNFLVNIQIRIQTRGQEYQGYIRQIIRAGVLFLFILHLMMSKT